MRRLSGSECAPWMSLETASSSRSRSSLFVIAIIILLLLLLLMGYCDSQVAGVESLQATHPLHLGMCRQIIRGRGGSRRRVIGGFQAEQVAQTGGAGGLG